MCGNEPGKAPRCHLKPLADGALLVEIAPPDRAGVGMISRLSQGRDPCAEAGAPEGQTTGWWTYGDTYEIS